MIDCDFIPASYHLERSLKGAILTRASMLSTLLVIMILWFFAHQHEVASAQAMLTEVAGQHEQIEVHKAKRESMEKEQGRLREQQLLVRRLDERSRLVVVLSDISRLLPDAVLLTEITVDGAALGRFTRETPPPVTAKGGVLPSGELLPRGEDKTPAREKPDHARLRLIGIATAAPEVLRFAAALEGSQLLRRVQLVSQEQAEWAGRRAERFEITCDLVDQKGVGP